ncbi:transcriptional regulator [Tenericutes bacterium MZ-XQ]|nr:transcriptional regulator [Tenericutes bacterium MZ-XQ]
MSKKESYIKNRIRELRFMHDEMSQAQLSDLVGVSRQTIVAVEKGNYTPSLDLAFKIAEVFDLTIEEIFFKDEETYYNKSSNK